MFVFKRKLKMAGMGMVESWELMVLESSKRGRVVIRWPPRASRILKNEEAFPNNEPAGEVRKEICSPTPLGKESVWG